MKIFDVVLMMLSYILCTITVNNDLAIYRNIYGIKRYNWMSGLKQHNYVLCKDSCHCFLHFDVNVMTLKTCHENVSRRTNQFGTKNKTICLGIYVSKIDFFLSSTLHNMNINIKNSIYRFNNCARWVVLMFIITNDSEITLQNYFFYTKNIYCVVKYSSRYCE